MCRIVFWNVKQKELTSLVCDIAKTTCADIIVINEPASPINNMLRALQSSVNQNFYVPQSNSEDRFHCFCRDASFDLSEVHKGFRTSIRKLSLGANEVLLGLVHGLDIRNYDSETRQAAAQFLADEIHFVKTNRNHNRVVLIGDFNMNPFDSGMNLAMGLNAMMTKACITSGTRVFAGKKFDFFYNPMWSLLGDRSEGPAGTIYNTSNQGLYGWSMLDQVIVSHSVVHIFESVEILTRAGDARLTNAKGRPDKKAASDHLPVEVRLKGLDHD